MPSGADGGVVRVAASASTTFVLLADGTFVPFGDCESWCFLDLGGISALYPNAGSPQSVIQSIPGEIIVDLAVYRDHFDASSGHSIFCTASGKVYTAGISTNGVLMRTGAQSTFSPTQVTFDPAPSGYRLYCKKVIAGKSLSMVLMRDGSVWSSGQTAATGQPNPGSITEAATKLDISGRAFLSDAFVARDIFALTPDLTDTGVIAVGGATPAFLSSKQVYPEHFLFLEQL
jgi:alpha-tubulin suppressor-like RCC1 family protein